MSEGQNKNPQTPDFTKSDEYVSLYVNHSQLNISQWDVQMNFSILQTGRILVEGQVKHLATVIMSPMHAKAFYNALAETLKIYEKEYGDIKLPDNPKPNN